MLEGNWRRECGKLHQVYIPLPETGWGGEGSEGSRLYIFHYKVGYHYRNWGSHGCAMDLLVKGIAEGKVCG